MRHIQEDVASTLSAARSSEFNDFLLANSRTRRASERDEIGADPGPGLDKRSRYELLYTIPAESDRDSMAPDNPREYSPFNPPSSPRNTESDDHVVSKLLPASFNF
jgi:hypothetical protein